MEFGTSIFSSVLSAGLLFFKRKFMRKEIISFHGLLLGVIKKCVEALFSHTLEKASLGFSW